MAEKKKKKVSKVLEEVIRTEVRKALLNQLKFDVYHPADSGYTVDPRPDLLAHGSNLAVECKITTATTRDAPTFNVGNIRWNQRAWMETWVEYRKREGFLALGTAARCPDFPTRTIWVIPWHEWVSFELNTIKLLNLEEKATPFSVSAIEINKVFWDRRMVGSPTAGFTFPDGHPILQVKGGGLPDWRAFKNYTCPMWVDDTTPDWGKKKEGQS